MAEVFVTPDFSYNPDSIEYRPRLAGDHPYRTSTIFMRDSDGKPIKDAEGYLVPVAHRDEKAPATIKTAEEFLAARKRIAEKKEQEKKAMAKERRRVNKRQGIGDPACEQSRDEDFPLLAVLRRDKMDDAIYVVMEYRRLASICAAEPLKGMSYSNREATGLSVEYVSKKMDGVAEVNAAKKGGWKVEAVPGGEIEYDGRVRRSKGSYSVAPKRKKAVYVDAYFDGEGGTSKVGITESLHVRVTEDVMHERIDKLPLLMRIRSALGPLVDPFEDAVIGGQTLMKIGNDRGFVGKVAATAGKAVVMEAINEVSKFLGRKNYVAANDNYLIEYKKAA